MTDDIKLITPLSNGLPKTGQITEIIVGGDGTYQAGWWLGTKHPNLRTRFIIKEWVLNQAWVMDLATNLMWPQDVSGIATDGGKTKGLADAIDYCEGLDFGGFNDWRMPNILELCSLVNAGRVEPSAYIDVFENWVATRTFHTSTQIPDDYVYSYLVGFMYRLAVTSVISGAPKYFLPVRSI